MKIKQLIKELSQLNPDLEVHIADGGSYEFNELVSVQRSWWDEGEQEFLDEDELDRDERYGFVESVILWT